MATLLIRNLAARCRLGVYPRERRRAQTIWIDAELQLRPGRAQAGRLAGTVDYAALIRRLRMLCHAKPYGLMETLSETLMRELLAHRQVRRATLRVKKKALPGLEYAGLELTRSKPAPP